MVFTTCSGIQARLLVHLLLKQLVKRTMLKLVGRKNFCYMVFLWNLPDPVNRIVSTFQDCQFWQLARAKSLVLYILKGNIPWDFKEAPSSLLDCPVQYDQYPICIAKLEQRMLITHSKYIFCISFIIFVG